MPYVGDSGFYFRRGSATEWSSENPVLEDGEVGIDTTNQTIKIGDGVTAWESLPITLGE